MNSFDGIEITTIANAPKRVKKSFLNDVLTNLNEILSVFYIGFIIIYLIFTILISIFTS